VAALPTGTLTLLFSDIEGSTRLLKRLGEEWAAVLERHRALLRAAILASDGTVVDCQGDALFAVFRSGRGSTAAAAAAQRALAGETWPRGVDVAARMALHTGEPQRAGDGYAGIDVVRAARLCAVANGRQVVLTEAARLTSGAETVDLGEVALRDLDRPERVHQLVADGLPREPLPLRADAGGSPALRSLSDVKADAQRRIDDASRDLEARITDDVSRRVAAMLRRVGPSRD
jgi:class 3 adenylate cyclase